MRSLLLAATAAAMLASCSGKPTNNIVPLDGVEPPRLGWRADISDNDLLRIEDISATWDKALESVARRDRRLVTREAELLDPDAAKAHGFAPPGSYTCRLVRVGNRGERGTTVRTFPDFFCYIGAEKGGRRSFTKQTGSELPGGWLYQDGEDRMVLVGAKQRAPGDNSVPYGEAPESDLVGIVERIGPFRWRLVLPWREERPGLDVYELTPVGVEQQAPERETN